MRKVRIGCYGVNGHQLFGLFPHLKNAVFTSVSGVTDEEYNGLVKDKNIGHIIRRARRFRNLNEMLESETEDAVCLCSPRRDEQAGDIILAIKAGKHVLAEKPLATRIKDLKRIRRATKGANVEVRAMLTELYNPGFSPLRRLVQAGKIGEIINIYAQKSYPYHDKRPQDMGIDGGLILQAGIHAISLIRWVTGLDIVSVMAYETGKGNPKKGELQMAASISFKLSNGGVGCANFNYLNPSTFPCWGNDHLRVNGTGGMAEVVDGGTRRTIVTNKSKPYQFPAGHEKWEDFTQAFVDLVRIGNPMRFSLGDSFRATEIVLRAQQSAITGREVII